MINELATSTKENTISSREVAEMMGVRHCDLLEKIDSISKDLATENSVAKYWIEGTFENRGKHYREYQVKKRGCEFLAHKTTGTKGNLFTDKYMDRFEEMEKKYAADIKVSFPRNVVRKIKHTIKKILRGGTEKRSNANYGILFTFKK